MFDTESLCFESKGHDQDTEAACTTVLSFENSNSFALSVTAGLRQISSGTLRHPTPPPPCEGIHSSFNASYCKRFDHHSHRGIEV